MRPQVARGHREPRAPRSSSPPALPAPCSRRSRVTAVGRGPPGPRLHALHLPASRPPPARSRSSSPRTLGRRPPVIPGGSEGALEVGQQAREAAALEVGQQAREAGARKRGGGAGGGAASAGGGSARAVLSTAGFVAALRPPTPGASPPPSGGPMSTHAATSAKSPLVLPHTNESYNPTTTCCERDWRLCPLQRPDPVAEQDYGALSPRKMLLSNCQLLLVRLHAILLLLFFIGATLGHAADRPCHPTVVIDGSRARSGAYVKRPWFFGGFPCNR